MKHRIANFLAMLFAFVVGVAGARFWTDFSEIDSWRVRNMALSFLFQLLALGIAALTIKMVGKSRIKTLVSFVLLGFSGTLVSAGFLIFFDAVFWIDVG